MVDLPTVAMVICNSVLAPIYPSAANVFAPDSRVSSGYDRRLDPDGGLGVFVESRPTAIRVWISEDIHMGVLRFLTSL